MRNQTSDDELFFVLSSKPITDEQFAHHINDDACQSEAEPTSITDPPENSRRRTRTWFKPNLKREKLLDDIG